MRLQTRYEVWKNSRQIQRAPARPAAEHVDVRRLPAIRHCVTAATSSQSPSCSATRPLGRHSGMLICYGRVRRVRDARDVHEAFREHFEKLDREMLVVLLLDGKNQVLGFNVVSIGSLAAALVHRRGGAASLIVASSGR